MSQGRGVRKGPKKCTILFEWPHTHTHTYTHTHIHTYTHIHIDPHIHTLSLSRTDFETTSYRVCHGFRFTTRDDYYWVDLDHFWSKHRFFEAAGAVVEISLGLQSSNRNQVKLAQICETHCRIIILISNLKKSMFWQSFVLNLQLYIFAVIQVSRGQFHQCSMSSF